LAEPITPKIVASIYLELKNHNPEPIIKFMEAFVGLMKPKEASGKRDVELYLRTHEKLTYKMSMMVE
jgi:hypothetical protein